LLSFCDVYCTAVSQVDHCNDAAFTNFTDLLRDPSSSLKTINAVVLLLTAVVSKNGT